MSRRVTGKPTIAALAAIGVGALLYTNRASTVVSVIGAIAAGVIAYIVWGAFENLLEKGMDKGAEKAGEAVSNIYHKIQDKKENKQ